MAKIDYLSKIILILLVLLSVQEPAQAQNASSQEAESSAVAFVEGLHAASPADLYNTMISNDFRRQIILQQFGLNLAFLRIQTGGNGKAMKVIGSTGYSVSPQGAKGNFFYVRVRVEYPNGPNFVDVYLSRVGLAWSVDSYFFLPAPAYCLPN